MSISDVIRDGDASFLGYTDTVTNEALLIRCKVGSTYALRISLVLRKRLHCTICDAHIGAYLGLKEMDIEHPLLKVLACAKCTLKYHYLEFPLNPDGRDIRCRWCTESAKGESPLRFCSYCPFAFCEMCIYRNLPLDELASNKNNWVCFVCNIKDLWPSRAVLWALRVLIDTNLALKEEKKWSTDQSTCCKNKATKQRRQVTLPPTIISNGHQPPPLRPIIPTQVNNFRMGFKNPVRPAGTGRPMVRPILPITPTRALPMSCQNSSTQLYDTAWLTEKVQSISTTLLNLNNNLHRIAQGIPEKENKYSIKSKMISMVSLLNISATQLQKASKEMEEESKKILDKNYKVAKVVPVSIPSSTEVNKVLESKVVLKPVLIENTSSNKTPARKRSVSSSGRNKRLKRSSEYDSEEEDMDDPDFLSESRPAGEGPTTRLRTRACFVKLERLDEKMVEDFKVEDGFEPKPSTSKAPDPLGTVSPEELKALTGENGESVDVKDGILGESKAGDESSKKPGPSDESGKEPGSSEESGKERGSSEESGKEPGPSEESGKEPGISEESGKEPGPSEESSEEPGQSEESGKEPSPSKESSEEPGQSEESGNEPGPSEESGKEPGSSEESGKEPSPSKESSEEPGQSEESGNEPGPSEESGKEPGSSEESGNEPGPSEESDKEPGSSEESGNEPGSSEDSTEVTSQADPTDSAGAAGDSQPAGSSLATNDDTQPHDKNPQPVDPAEQTSCDDDTNAPQSGPKTSDAEDSASVTTTDDANFNGDVADDLNESSATDSSITDSSTTSADTSDS